MSEIYKALLMAQRAINPVEKTSANNFHRYKYASAEAMVEEARRALNGAGLVCICKGWIAGHSHNDHHPPQANVIYTLAHESGETLEFHTTTPVIEEKGRPLDKAVATALTYNLGYFLRGLLLMPRVEEGTDVDQRDDRRHEPKKNGIAVHVATTEPDAALAPYMAAIAEAAAVKPAAKAAEEMRGLYKGVKNTKALSEEDLAKLGAIMRDTVAKLESA